MYAVYVLEHSIHHTLYIGYTNNLKRRLEEHNTRLTKSTIRNDGKWILVYSELYRDRDDAVRREQAFKKHGSAKQKLLQRIKGSRLSQN